MSDRFEYRLKHSMNPVFDSQCTDSQIQQLEIALKKDLPTDYRQFLTQWNGLDFDDIDSILVAKCDDSDEVVSLDELYGIAPGHEDDILGRQGDYSFNERVPDNYFAIGGINGPARITMNLLDGAIYGWDPILPGEPSGVNVKHTAFLVRVAANFYEFWDSLELRPL